MQTEHRCDENKTEQMNKIKTVLLAEKNYAYV